MLFRKPSVTHAQLKINRYFIQARKRKQKMACSYQKNGKTSSSLTECIAFYE
jgi:hypothetical protein